MKKSIQMNIQPTFKQSLGWKYLLDDKTRFVTFGGGKGGGKSWLGCEWLITMCLKYPGVKYFVARNELTRLMKSTYLTFVKVFHRHKIPDECWKLNSKWNFIEFWNKSRIDLFDLSYQPRDPLYERFGSMEFTGGWFEEVGEIREKAADALNSTLGRQLNKEYGIFPKSLNTCNPKKHWIYQTAYKPWRMANKESKTDTWMDYSNPKKPIQCCFIQSLYMDNPHTAEYYGNVLDLIKDPVMKARLKDGNWEYVDDKGVIINYQCILNMFTRQPTGNLNLERIEEKEYDYDAIEETHPELKHYITCDVARFGRDKAVIMLWLGFHVRKIWYYNKSSTRFLREKIESICLQYHIPYTDSTGDDDGVGSGVLDYIPGMIRFVNGSPAVEEEDEDTQETVRFSYRNLRSQCYFKMAEAINKNLVTIDIKGIVIPEDDIDRVTPYDVKNWIIDELEVVKRKEPENNEMKLQIIPKEEMKAALAGRSPDFSDTIMQRWIFELGRASRGEVGIV